MKTISLIIVTVLISWNTLDAQQLPANDKIDEILFKGEFQKVIDTCRTILKSDSLNHGIYYRLGLAYQNLLDDENAFSCFLKASELEPGVSDYRYQLAKCYYKAEKYKQAEPLFKGLCAEDSLRWTYAYYLTTIYMIQDRYDNAIEIYKRFLQMEPANFVYIDKLAFALLKKQENNEAIRLYYKSLSLNPRDITALKNLAYLYTLEQDPDTAVTLLTRGIKIDPDDLDLYSRRAQINFYRNYNAKALADYLVLLGSGDSSITNLKRAGIEYCNTRDPSSAVKFLLIAYRKDSSDYETCSYLGQSYYLLGNMKKSIYFYDKVIEILNPIYRQMGQSRMLLAESQKEAGLYSKAIANYQFAQNISPDPNIWMIMANIYDEKLKDQSRSIYYYQKFVDTFKNSKTDFVPDYIESIRKRIEYIKTHPGVK